MNIFLNLENANFLRRIFIVADLCTATFHSLTTVVVEYTAEPELDH